MRPDKTLRVWGLILAGVGLAIALVVGWWYNNSVISNWAISFYSELIAWAGWGMVAGGLILLVIDIVLRRTAHRPSGRSTKPAKSLRCWALSITGAGAVAFLLLWLWLDLATRGLVPGVPVMVLGMAGYGAFFLIVGGLATLLVDTVLRLTKHHF